VSTTRAHPQSIGMILVTMRIVLTLDLGHNNHFARPPPFLPPEVVKDLMDVDLLEDFVFLDAKLDLDHESNSSFISFPSLSFEIEEETPLVDSNANI